MESYILTRSMHLGYLKETFGKGAVIQYYPDKNKVIIDGRPFNDYRDVEILKRQAVKTPHSPFIVQYSEEALQDILGESTETVPAIPKRAPNGEGMEIVQSDEDSHTTIDIRHTQVSKNNQAAKESQKQKTASEKLPVVQGYQSVEDRIAELNSKKNTDMAARAEKVRLMGTSKAEMPIVRDDSLGSVGGSASSAMNAGSIVGGKRAEDASDDVSAMADARKREVQMNREKVAEEIGVDLDQAGVDEVTPSPEGLLEEVEETVAIDKDAEIAALRKQLEEATAPAPEPAPVDPRDAEIAALRKQLEEANSTPAAPPRAKKMPVVTSKEG